MTSETYKSGSHQGEGDALDELVVQNRLVTDLLDRWQRQTEELVHEGDDVDTRWERGSAAKLLLQHLAVRESAKEHVVAEVRAAGDATLADRLEADGPSRRALISRLDEEARGHQAITLNNPDVDRTLSELGPVLREEMHAEDTELIPSVRRLLGSSEDRDLAGARAVRMQAVTHPNPNPKWYDKIGPLKAIRALYDHLRSSPSGLTSPSVDKAREHMPGPRP